MENNKFKTSDIYLAAYLIVSGLDYKVLRDPQSRYIEFEFTNSTQLQELLQLYQSSQDLVSAKQFSHQIKVLKAIIISQKEQKGVASRSKKN